MPGSGIQAGSARKLCQERAMGQEGGGLGYSITWRLRAGTLYRVLAA